jgi:7,8-dihydropterin-6-yl-methyl-4-(beta-D-ribofuranosyl)aminobenzene 5'-phosphate synthase
MITIHCLVDNQSSDPARFQAEHGVAFVIEPPSGKVLFDTGQSGSALLHNAAQMNIDLHAIDALALSHAHDDHTGGLKSFLQHSQPGLPVYAHPDLFRQRYSAKDGVPRARGLPVTQSQLAGRATLR